VIEMRVMHTAELTAGERAAARALLYDVFADMTEADWEHALGGMHALVREGADVAGHAAVVMRRVIHRDRALRAGCVEGVAVRKDRRRLGVGAAMMQALERFIRGGYDLGVLGASDEAAAFYTRRTGWCGRPTRTIASSSSPPIFPPICPQILGWLSTSTAS
jgi:aminoglycoside 2'-N-acetyltransferase I